MEKEGVKKDVTFRKILLNRCQKEFEKEKSIEKRIHEKLEALTKEGLSVSSDTCFGLFLFYLDNGTLDTKKKASRFICVMQFLVTV